MEFSSNHCLFLGSFGIQSHLHVRPPLVLRTLTISDCLFNTPRFSQWSEPLFLSILGEAVCIFIFPLFPRFWLFPRLRITWDSVVNGGAKKHCRQQLKISSLSPVTAAFISNLKSKNPGRQIASVWSWPTERISSYIHKIMGPIVNLPSFTLTTNAIFSLISSSPAKTKSLLLWTHSPSFLTWKAFKHLSIFPINVLSKNRTRILYFSSWLN